MTTIHLTTIIKAPKQIVFDVSRNIDIHQQSAASSREKAIAGVTAGLINLNETVTWHGKHFGFYLTHKSRITAMTFYDYFADEMVEGKFKSFRIMKLRLALLENCSILCFLKTTCLFFF
jgi:hypothetical protein